MTIGICLQGASIRRDFFWTTGITIEQRDSGRWVASADFQDGAHCADGAASGTVRSTYEETSLDEAVDAVARSLSALGIHFLAAVPPRIYYAGDGEDPGTPDNWRQIADDQMKRLGWDQYQAN